MKPRIKSNNKHTVNNKQKVVECLMCYEKIDVGLNPRINKFITCKNCEMVFEIINLDPIMIDWPYYDDDIYDDEESYSEFS